MITTPKDIYKRVAEKHNLLENLVESIGNIVFKDTRDKLNEPKELAYELPGLCTFVLRFRKFEKYYLNFKACVDREDENCLKKLELNPERYHFNGELYKKMLAYREDKEKTKQIRNEQNQALQSGEDQPS